MATNEEVKLLERQPGEQEEAWIAYLRYRELRAPRRKRHLSRNGGEAYQRILAWSKRFKWDERVRIYDSQLDAARRQGVQDAITSEVKAALQRHAKNAYAFNALVMKVQGAALKRVMEDEQVLELMEIRQLLDVVLQCARLLPSIQQEERNAMGVNPTLNLVLDKDLGSMSDEELQQFIRSAESLVGTR